GICQDAALPAGGAVAGEKGADPGQVGGSGGVDVDAVAAVGVQVDKAGDQRHAAQVHRLAAFRGGQVRADAVNDAAADQHVGSLKHMVAVDAGVLEQDVCHHVHLPLVRLPGRHVVDINAGVGMVLRQRGGEFSGLLAVGSAADHRAVPVTENAQADLPCAQDLPDADGNAAPGHAFQRAAQIAHRV